MSSELLDGRPAMHLVHQGGKRVRSVCAEKSKKGADENKKKVDEQEVSA